LKVNFLATQKEEKVLLTAPFPMSKFRALKPEGKGKQKTKRSIFDAKCGKIRKGED